MKYESLFIAAKQRVTTDLGDNFQASLFDSLALSLNYKKISSRNTDDQYLAKTAKVPAYYNPNTHTVHLNIGVIENTNDDVVENIYYHELLHACSHHARMTLRNGKVLKSGLKIQLWDENDKPTTLHRGLNEGLTQYFANSYTKGGPAYRREVQIIGRLIRRIGLSDLRAAYFGAAIDQLERKVAAMLGSDAFNRISELVDAKEFDEAEALIG